MRRLGALLLKKKRPWWARAARDAKSLEEIVDPEIEALPAESRARLAAIWQKRGGLELRVAAGFSSMSLELFEHGAIPAVYEIVGLVKDFFYFLRDNKKWWLAPILIILLVLSLLMLLSTGPAAPFIYTVF